MEQYLMQQSPGLELEYYYYKWKLKWNKVTVSNGEFCPVDVDLTDDVVSDESEIPPEVVSLWNSRREHSSSASTSLEPQTRKDSPVPNSHVSNEREKMERSTLPPHMNVMLTKTTDSPKTSRQEFPQVNANVASKASSKDKHSSKSTQKKSDSSKVLVSNIDDSHSQLPKITANSQKFRQLYRKRGNLFETVDSTTKELQNIEFCNGDLMEEKVNYLKRKYEHLDNTFPDLDLIASSCPYIVKIEDLFVRGYYNDMPILNIHKFTTASSNDRVVYYNEGGNCVFCFVHGEMSSDSHKCPYLQCTCALCYSEQLHHEIDLSDEEK